MTPFRRHRFLKLWSAITVLAILCITGLELFAMWRDLDTPQIRVSEALIAGLAGAGLGRISR